MYLALRLGSQQFHHGFKGLGENNIVCTESFLLLYQGLGKLVDS